MRLAPGVNLIGIRPELAAALPMIEAAYKEAAGIECTLTSIERSGSGQLLHAKGRACDCRVFDVPKGKWVALRDAIKARLGGQFDVILENPDNLPSPPFAVSPHIHVEFDPKNPDGSKMEVPA